MAYSSLILVNTLFGVLLVCFLNERIRCSCEYPSFSAISLIESCIFSGNNIKSIYDAINTDNITYLTRFPKISDKVAKQIILDLKGKLTTQTDLFQQDSKELIEVLESLGYKVNDIKKIITKIDISLSLENQIKEALKLLGK